MKTIEKKQMNRMDTITNTPTFIKVNKGLFVRDDDNSNKYTQWYVTEMGMRLFKIERCCCNGPTPFYTLFHEWREKQDGKWRTFSDRLFASSKLDKIINYFNDNL